jgi:hypothetical protein
LGAYVLAALPQDSAAPTNLAAANANDELYDGKLEPTAAGPLAAAVEAVAAAAPRDLQVVAGMISTEGGARVNTHAAHQTRRHALGSATPAHQSMATSDHPVAAMSGQGSAQVVAGGVLGLPSGVVGTVTGSAGGTVSAGPGAARVADAPAAPQVTATPTHAPADSGSGHKGAIVLGTLFAAAAGYSLRRRFSRKQGA